MNRRGAQKPKAGFTIVSARQKLKYNIKNNGDHK